MNFGRKVSGGKYKKQRKKKLYERTSAVRSVKLGKLKKKRLRVRGGRLKIVLISSDEANIVDKKSKKTKKAKIENVLETPSNKFLARQNILVKGAVIETSLGKARITNRPSQEAYVQAEMIEEKDNS